MKVTTIIENLVYQKGLIAEHGLSFYFEADGLRFLMDVGQTSAFYSNAGKLGISVENIDYLIISHGHYDHTGGIRTFAEHNSKAKIILKREALEPKYKGYYYIGMPRINQDITGRLVFADGEMKLSESVTVFTNIEERYPIDSHKNEFVIKDENGVQPDNFDDELFVCLHHNDKCSVISSCSHNGITNILNQAILNTRQQLHTVLGGYHIKNAKPEVVEHIVGKFNEYDIQQVGFSHCSGIENYALFCENCMAKVFYNYTGNVVFLDS